MDARPASWQVPILTNDLHGRACILDVRAKEIMDRLVTARAVMAGLCEQPKRSRCNARAWRIDTSAVALAAAIDATGARPHGWYLHK